MSRNLSAPALPRGRRSKPTRGGATFRLPGRSVSLPGGSRLSGAAAGASGSAGRLSRATTARTAPRSHSSDPDIGRTLLAATSPGTGNFSAKLPGGGCSCPVAHPHRTHQSGLLPPAPGRASPAAPAVSPDTGVVHPAILPGAGGGVSPRRLAHARGRFYRRTALYGYGPSWRLTSI